jgi:hypothetical protein
MDTEKEQPPKKSKPTILPLYIRPEMIAEIHSVKPVDTSVAQFIRDSIRAQIKTLTAEKAG